MSSTTPPSGQQRAGTRAQYGIRFSPYLWVRKAPLATPLLHVVLEALATAVDPDGCYSWLSYDSLSGRSRNASESAVRTSVRTMEQGKILRRIAGEERFAILDAHGVRYTRDKPPLLVELLIPASAYSAEDLVRVNRMRADRGRPPITAESRPDITEMAGARKKRADAGQAAPQRRTKKERAAEAVAQEPLPPVPDEPDMDLEMDLSLDSTFEDTTDVPQLPDAEGPTGRHRFDKPDATGLINRTPPVSKTGNPMHLDPSDADPNSSPSVSAQPQRGETAGQGTDGADIEGSAQQEKERDVPKAGEDASRPPKPRVSEESEETVESLPPTLAEMVVDRLLKQTEHLGAKLLADPVKDRAHLVGLAARAFKSGMSASQLWSITSVGLHNVHKQWALTARLADPIAFAKIRQADFGGTPLGGQAPAPLCEIHPTAAPDARSQCGECAEIERQAALARGEVEEFIFGADGIWRDHTGTPLSQTWDWEGLSEEQISQELADRERMRAELINPTQAGAASARENLRRANLRRLTVLESDEAVTDGVSR